MGCLYAGCVYRVRIRAQNASGWGQYSVPCDVKAAAGVPHAPTAPKAVGQSAIAIELAWEAPQHDGGSDIISYRLEMSSGISSSARLHQIIHAAFTNEMVMCLPCTQGTLHAIHLRTQL